MPRAKKELRQFICRDCPGKHSYHEYRIWYDKVRPNVAQSQCHVCEGMFEAVERGKEEGVHICNFTCDCGHPFIVQCEMSDTAPCYECWVWSSPHSFQPWRKINNKSGKPHHCSKCNGRGNCPNKRQHHHCLTIWSLWQRTQNEKIYRHTTNV